MHQYSFGRPVVSCSIIHSNSKRPMWIPEEERRNTGYPPRLKLLLGTCSVHPNACFIRDLSSITDKLSQLLMNHLSEGRTSGAY